MSKILSTISCSDFSIVPSSVPCSIKSSTSSSVTASLLEVFTPKTNATPLAIAVSIATNGFISMTITRNVLYLLSKKCSGSRLAANLGKNSPSSRKINVVTHSAIVAEIICACSTKLIFAAINGLTSTAHTPANIPVNVIPICATLKGAGDSIIDKTARASSLPSSDNFSSRPR